MGWGGGWNGGLEKSPEEEKGKEVGRRRKRRAEGQTDRLKRLGSGIVVVHTCNGSNLGVEASSKLAGTTWRDFVSNKRKKERKGGRE